MNTNMNTLLPSTEVGYFYLEEEKYVKNYESKVEQLELLMVKEEEKRVSAKRVNIVSLKMIRDSSILYQNRHIRSPQDSYDIIRTFLEDSDREMFIAMCVLQDKSAEDCKEKYTSLPAFNSVFISDVIKRSLL